MPRYTIKLKSKREIADGTMAFHFEKPGDFSYKAGQFGSFTLINPAETDADGNTRAFSFASAPYEDDLIIATRMRDTAFKRTLGRMEPGMEIMLNAPHGAFTLHEDTDLPAVFLTGGIGITPVRSMVLQAIHDQVPHRILVFYSNRKPEDASFLDDLHKTHSADPYYTLAATMTQMEKSSRDWHGATGYISKTLLLNHLDDLKSPIYYLVGPPAMVATMRTMLDEAEVDAGHIRTEQFSGY